jgi:LytS/YehU family sensor histidine kinase
LSGLSNLLRYLISSKEAIEVTLNQELQQIFFFAEIQKIRFEGRLILSTKQRVSDQEIERIKIPKLFIYHFIENAVKYSTENTNRVGIVSILIKKENEDYYYLEIEDNGVGSTDNKNKTSTGIGLQSNRELIEVLNRNNEKYKISFNLLFKDAPESGVIVQIFIPIHYNYNLEYESINSRRRVPLASHFRKSIERN